MANRSQTLSQTGKFKINPMMSKTLKKKDLDMLSGISKGSKSKKGLLSSAKLQTKLKKKDAPTNTSVHTKDLVAKLKEYRELQ